MLVWHLEFVMCQMCFYWAHCSLGWSNVWTSSQLPASCCKLVPPATDSSAISHILISQNQLMKIEELNACQWMEELINIWNFVYTVKQSVGCTLTTSAHQPVLYVFVCVVTCQHSWNGGFKVLVDPVWKCEMAADSACSADLWECIYISFDLWF